MKEQIIEKLLEQRGVIVEKIVNLDMNNMNFTMARMEYTYLITDIDSQINNLLLQE